MKINCKSNDLEQIEEETLKQLRHLEVCETYRIMPDSKAQTKRRKRNNQKPMSWRDAYKMKDCRKIKHKEEHVDE